VLLYTNSNADPAVPAEALLYTNCNSDPFVPAEDDLLTADVHINQLMPVDMLYDVHDIANVDCDVASDLSIEALKRVMQLRIAYINKIPQSAIRSAADTFSRLLKSILKDPKDIEAHSRLFLFAPFVLCQFKDKRTKKVAGEVKRKSSLFCNASFEYVVLYILESAQQLEDRPSSCSASIKTVKKLISLGRYGDAVKMLNSNGVHDCTSSVMHELADKHPQCNPSQDEASVLESDSSD
jgi:hypothetical protein